ncbi:MAG TPA: ribokinase [Chloroflexota bacterium]|nr:ribokinase [Chloroflexota bacterium]
MPASDPVIVVVGSVNVDMIVRSETLPRPGETVVGGELLTAGGGKGANQAVAARRLGADVRFIACVGQDPAGSAELARLQEDGLATSWVRIDAAAPTGTALILVDRHGQNMISVAPGANARLSPADVQAARMAFASAQVLLVQLEVPLDTVRAALELGRAHGLITILNPAPAGSLPDDLLRLVDWLTPNEVEAAALLGTRVEGLEAALAAARALRMRGPRHVVITLGAQGAVYAGDGDGWWVPPFPVAAVDSTAAGDAFNAALAVALAEGRPIPEVLRYAGAAGACAVTHAGARPSLPSRDDVAALLARAGGATVTGTRG